MIQVLKAGGEIEAFNEEKIRSSILRAGIAEPITEEAVAYIKSHTHNNISTSKIYNLLLDFLEKKNPPFAKKYGLKQAIMSLGPTGYPFEDYIAKLLTHEGYSTTVRSILQGKCISHEIDVLAQKNGKKIMIEAKYHNLPGTKTNVHVAMYTKARFNDILERNDVHEVWLVTNTKITTDAITYAICMGMHVISWNYPEGDSLRERIERSGIMP